MIIRLQNVLRLTALGLALSVTAAQAQDWPEFLDTKQLFRVIVEGIGESGTKLQPVKGTAWAIAPDVLITADHVTGKAQNFKNKSPSDKVFIPYREVSVEFSAEKFDDGSDPLLRQGGFVTPSPFESLDAARIGFSDLRATAFQLTACEIVKDETYRVLKLNDGKVLQPKSVPIRLKAYGRSALGDAGSVVVMTAAKGTIVEGDSGSPVLTSENRVVGLVSAINSDSGSAVRVEVHVTLVRSFLDLIPLRIGQTEFLDIPCSERERLKQVDLLQQSIDKLTKEKDAMESRLDALEDRNEGLTQQVTTLLLNQVRLAHEAERASEKKTFDIPGWDNLKVFDKNLRMFDKYQEELANFLPAPPLRPTVSRISSELADPKWNLRGRIDTNQNVIITLSYERALSGPPYALDMYFCFRPIFWDLPGSVASDKNPKLKEYYEKFDGPFEEGSQEFKGCTPISHTSSNPARADAGSVTYGAYTWSVPGGLIRQFKAFHDNLYEETSWKGFYYLQVFEPAPAKNGGKELYTLHTRAIIDVLDETGKGKQASNLPCKHFQTSPGMSPDYLARLASGEQTLEEDDSCLEDI